MTDTARWLQGKGAVITGGGRGIGLAVAAALANRGAALVLAARTRSEIEAVAADLREAGHRAWAVPCDVGSESSVEELAAAAEAHLGQIDVLVNNAGIAPAAPLARLQLEEWERVLRVNVTGTFLCTRAFAPAMAGRGWGRVVNVASVAGLIGDRYIAAYAASKHAVVGFTRSVAAEMAASGVTVNAVCPGYVDTGMTDETLDNITSKTGLGRNEALSSILLRMPQRRLITAEEVAHAVAFLCHDASRGITGCALPIDGGELSS